MNRAGVGQLPVTGSWPTSRGDIDASHPINKVSRSRCSPWHINRWLAARAERPANQASKVSELLQARLELAGGLSGLMCNAYAAGEVTASACHEANLNYLSAQLDCCNCDSDRIKVLERFVEAAKSHETLVEKENRAGSVTAMAVMKAQLATLEAELALAKVKAARAAR